MLGAPSCQQQEEETRSAALSGLDSPPRPGAAFSASRDPGKPAVSSPAAAVLYLQLRSWGRSSCEEKSVTCNAVCSSSLNCFSLLNKPAS